MIFQTTLIWVTIFDEFNARDIIDTYRQTTMADIYILSFLSDFCLFNRLYNIVGAMFNNST